MKENYNSIDLSKFIFAILVVMIHAVPFGDSATNGSIFGSANFFLKNYISRLAVPMFFLYTGFFVFQRKDVRKYVLKLARVYCIWSLIYFPLAIKSIYDEEQQFLKTVLVYIRNFLFTGSYTHLWYVNATIFAVVVIAILMKCNVQIVVILRIAMLLYVIGLFDGSWFGMIVPLREHTPFLWESFKLLRKIIVTTRDGLFFGLVFVSMGAWLATRRIIISRTKSMVGLTISMICLFVETYLLDGFGVSRSYDMHLGLLPAAFFTFCLISNLELKDNQIYSLLRELSVLIFYIHLLVRYLVDCFLCMINIRLRGTGLRFVFTLVVSIIISYLIVIISNTYKFRFVKKLYS